MEITWKIRTDNPKKISFLVLMRSMIAPAIFKREFSKVTIETKSLWSQ